MAPLAPLTEPPRGRGSRPLLAIGGICAGLIAAGVWLWHRPAPDDLLAVARKAAETGHWDEALAAASTALRREPNSIAARLACGEAAAHLDQRAAALDFYAAVDDDRGTSSYEARRAAGYLLLYESRTGDAEEQFRRALQLAPDGPAAHHGLGRALTMQGRRWEALPHLLQALRAGHFEQFDLVLLSDIDRMVGVTDEELEYFRSGRGGERLAAARAAIAASQFESAAALLAEALALSPDLLEAHVRRGELLLIRGEDAGFEDWQRELPPAADEHPETWVIRGRWAVTEGRTAEAARCFAEAVRRHPNHAAAHHELAQTLRVLGRTEDAQTVQDRSDLLNAFILQVETIVRTQGDAATWRAVAELAAQLGRLWEAAAWSTLTLQRGPGVSWPRQLLKQVQPRLTDDLPWTVPDDNPVARLDFSNLPLPRRDGTATRDSAPLLSRGSPAIRFRDDAAAVGLEFQYYNGTDASHEGRRMYEYTGGGVAALDYDVDGWPDLFWTQGARWPVRPESTEHSDAFFRNQADGEFRRVTESAGLTDSRFGQGVATGDINADGLPDLYVANIGANRLYVNQGDGTFVDTSPAAIAESDGWTTSCAIADINRDGFPDLYDVTFLAGADVFERVCEEDGRFRSCAPAGFPAADDRLWLSTGDGRFTDVAADCGLRIPDGDGLGIVVADFEGPGRRALFIANDGRPNFYFNVQSNLKGEVPLTMREEAVIRGVATDREGRAQACMGIAVDDADGDGLLDLFVTNFHNESNTLYDQIAPGMFVDGTQAAGLREPSVSMLGFGTQFLDADLDGWPDLIVANGHVDDFRYKGVPFEMRAQIFHNVGRGRFRELDAAQLGAYFEDTHLGRGLCLLDWNCDGLEDAAVSHLDDPAALLTNVSPKTGRSVTLRLIAVQSDRDALGAVVGVTADGRTRTRQVTAGSGYQASNSRPLVLGLADAEQIERWTIQWPSGRTQIVEGLTPGDQVVIVEGRDPLRGPGRPASRE